MSMRRRLSIPFAEREAKLHEKDIDHTLQDTTLQHTQCRSVDKKDFSNEVRGARDIRIFLDKSQVVLDMNESELEHIVESLLDAMNDDTENVTRSELHSLIFADTSRTLLSDRIQGTVSSNGLVEWEQTWLCASVAVPTLKKRHVGIARLRNPVNLGECAEEVRFFILVLCPAEIKSTKSALETGRTFSTLFSDVGLRHELYVATTVSEFKDAISKASKMFAEHQDTANLLAEEQSEDKDTIKWYQIGRGLKSDLSNRLPYYLDDFKDGIIGKNTLSKTTSTTLFLYFSVILPAVALGVLNAANTDNKISVQQVIVGQTIGALVFAFFAGQPLVVVMTTAPLALFIKIIYSISEDFEIDFLAFYAMVGLWNTFFLTLYSFFNMSVLMKYSSRSTEEIFSNFITIAFITDSTKNIVKTFNKYYWKEHCYGEGHDYEPTSTESYPPLLTDPSNSTVYDSNSSPDLYLCHPEVPFLSLILMLGTVWLGVTLFDFKKTPFLNKGKREILSDYALPVAVIVFSIIGRVLFSKVSVKTFGYSNSEEAFKLVDFSSLSVGAIFGAMGLGFSLSLLFFMDQNISAAMVNSPENKLLKGNAYHWDLFVIGLINAFLCIFGLPFLHAVLPHSPLHVKCLADTEERVENGYVRSIVVRVRETRLTNIFSNILIGISMSFLGYVLAYIPTAVLDGLFLYLAVTALYGNQMFERILLLFTEQAAYPPNHYIRKVPQRKIHTFTACQVCQLLVLCVFGFTPWPYIKMIFPVVILVFLPVRHLLIPLVVEEKYLKVLDGH